MGNLDKDDLDDLFDAVEGFVQELSILKIILFVNMLGTGFLCILLFLILLKG